MPPSPGETLEAVTLIFRALDPGKIDRMFSGRMSGQANQVRRLAAGALYYVGAADFDLVARLLDFGFTAGTGGGGGAASTIYEYQDMPRAIRDPWEATVRNLAYFWRNTPGRRRHEKAGVIAWASLPEIVKYVADNHWQRKIIVTGPMLQRLRAIAALDVYQPPVWNCPMCRKLERRGLLKRSVQATRKRARAIVCYRINQPGRRLLERADAESRRNLQDDPRADQPHVVAGD